MRDIQIDVNAARILSYSVTLGDDVPQVNATIGLFASGKKISEFSLNTQGYYQGLQFELPARLVPPIIDVASVLEEVLTEECSRAMGCLPAQTADVPDATTTDKQE